MTNIIQDTLFQQYSGPIWAGAATIFVKALDIISSKRKTKRDEMADINSAQANLNKSLQGGFAALQAELDRQREDNATLRAMLDNRDKRIEALQHELDELRERFTEADRSVQPVATGEPHDRAD